jgi:hypothetical protein
MPKFGPGTLKIGEVGSELDASCFVNSFTIAMTKDQADDTTKLCGTIKPGAITYTYSATGNFDIDSDDPAGLFALSQANPGAEVPFTFTPSTEGETSAAGTLILDPMDFGGDTYGADMTSDVEWSLVGAPVYTYPAAAPLGDRFAPTIRNGSRAALTEPWVKESTTVSPDPTPVDA